MSAGATAIERADALRRDGRPLDALRTLEEAIRQNPLDLPLWHHAGRAALEAKQYRVAINLLEFFVRGDPANWRALHRLGTAYFQVSEYEAADAAFARVLAAQPDLVQALIPYGVCRYALGDPAAGYAAHTRAIALASGDPSNEVGAALLRISRGDWGGWEQLEARWKVPSEQRQAKWSALEAQRWTGQPAPDRTLWLHPEGGLGDSILFCRYVPVVAPLAGRVVFSPPPPLARLMSGLPGLDAVIDATEHDPGSPEYLHAGLWSMPYLMRDTVESMPRDVPYLHAPADGPRLPERAPGARLRVGLVWSGNPAADHDCDRSVPRPEVLEPLWAVEGVEWVALQVGPRSEWAAHLPVTPGPKVRDVADTAFVLTQLDLTVSVDTSVANLAGAMGLPVWIMTPSLPEFRWPLEGPTSPWYPTATLFRRTRSADWPKVIAEVASALRERLAAGAPA